MFRAILVALMAAAMLAACAGGSYSGIPSTPDFSPLAGDAADTPPLPKVPRFTKTARAALLRNGTVSLPLGAGFAGTLTTKNAAIAKNTSALVTGTSLQLVQLALPKHAAPIFQIGLSPSNIADAAPSLQFTLPAKFIVAKARYYVALYDPSNPQAGWQMGASTKATMKGRTLSISLQSGVFMAPGLTYVLALYATYGAPKTRSALATYELNGTLTRTYSFFYTPPPSLPSPSPEPSAVIAANVSEAVTVVETSAPKGIPNGATLDAHVAEVDTTGLEATSSSSDSYVTQRKSGIYLYGSLGYAFAPFSAGADVTQTAYAAPVALLRTNAATWFNSPAATVTQTFADGHSYARTIASNGTYSETGSVAVPTGSPRPIAIVENSDGSGSYTAPFFLHGDTLFCEYEFAAPTSGSIAISGSPHHSLGSVPCATPVPVATPQAWFPAPPGSLPTQQGSPVFYDEEDTVNPKARIPKTCGHFSNKSALVTRTIWQLDTILGYSELTVTKTYWMGPAQACIVLSDTLDTYYNYSGNTTVDPTFAQSGQPLSETVTSELLSAASPAAADAVTPAIAAAEHHFMLAVQRSRDAILAGGRP